MAEPTTFPAPKSDLTVLLLGSGGREHALAFKLAQSPRVKRVLIAPGNGGTSKLGGKIENVNAPWGGKDGYEGVVKFAKDSKVDLVVPGPEQPLVDGAEREFRKGELPTDSIFQRWLTSSRYPRLRSFPGCRHARGI